MAEVPAVELKGITKRFGSVTANDSISLQIREGKILSLLGENGSGKTTLMNMISGIYQPDEGEIFVHGKPVSILSPKDAYEYGIGMIHQHYKLVDVFTAAENIVLGHGSGKLEIEKANRKVKEICDRYGFKIDPKKKVYDMSVSEKQTIEIIKVLYRGAEILILDEPTAVLTPQETDRLFDILRNMKNDDKAIVIITHKLNEVMELSDSVAILRKGKYIATVETSKTSPKELTDMMVGYSVSLNINRPKYDKPVPKLAIKSLICKDAEGVKKLNNVSFTAMGGEILGIAGVAGSGQKELLECISGLYPIESGEIMFMPDENAKVNLVGKTPIEIKKAGIAMAFVPEDRLGMGLVGSMGMTGNMMLRSWKKTKNRNSPFVDRKSPEALANKIWKTLEVVTPSTSFPVRRMSGGNIQKVLVGREIAQKPSVLLTAYAVRGLDINTSYAIYNLFTEEKMNGTAVIYVGEDLDVLLELCDRILVLCAGQVSGIVDARNTTKDKIGLLMTKVGGGQEDMAARDAGGK
ncbi:MAG TPA: ABC transporter ATP-binding protein [Spirochaetaceae bacterium]|nr:ABC transporter ATP-binding protein [Spirochaetaceae bacterium]